MTAIKSYILIPNNWLIFKMFNITHVNSIFLRGYITEHADSVTQVCRYNPSALKSVSFRFQFSAKYIFNQFENIFYKPVLVSTNINFVNYVKHHQLHYLAQDLCHDEWPVIIQLISLVFYIELTWSMTKCLKTFAETYADLIIFKSLILVVDILYPSG